MLPIFVLRELIDTFTENSAVRYVPFGWFTLELGATDLFLYFELFWAFDLRKHLLSLSLNLLKVFIFPLAKNVHFDLEMHLDFVNKAFNPGSGCTIVKLLIQWLFVLLVTIFTIISIVISEKPCQTLGTCFLQSLLFLLILVLLSVNSIAPVLTNTQQFFIFLLGPQFVLFFLLGAQLVLFFLLGAQLVLFCLFGNFLGLLNSFELSCSIRISLILWLDRIILINNMLNIISITTSSAQNVNSL